MPQWEIPIQVRFGDTDMMGHLNNAAYVQYLELARLHVAAEMERSGLPRVYTVLAHLEMDYRREVHFGQEVRVRIWTERVGSSSWQLGCAVDADGQLAAEGKTVQVCIDPETRRPSPISGRVRSYLEGS
jgi:acyl-CoA thioester hydrolase